MSMVSSIDPYKWRFDRRCTVMFKSHRSAKCSELTYNGTMSQDDERAQPLYYRTTQSEFYHSSWVKGGQAM
jgi:hypothetical protein